MAMFEGARNFRELGGIKTEDGRVVRPRVIFRSEILSRLTAGDLARASTLDVRLVCDLRSPAERAQESNRWPEQRSVQTVMRTGDVDLSGAEAANWRQRLLETDFDESGAHDYLLTAYRAMPAAFSGTLAKLFSHFDRPDHGSVLIHCVAGKDRTGFVCAMLLWALGVAMDDIVADYLVSAQRYGNSRRWAPLLERLFGAEVPARAAAAAAVIGTVSADYLDAAIDVIRRDYGSIDAYLSGAAGLDPERREGLRRRLLVDPGKALAPGNAVAAHLVQP